jgi:hypothetical protein
VDRGEVTDIIELHLGADTFNWRLNSALFSGTQQPSIFFYFFLFFLTLSFWDASATVNTF